MAPVTRNENQGMFRKLKDSVLSTAERYKGELFGVFSFRSGNLAGRGIFPGVSGWILFNFQRPDFVVEQ